MRRVLIERRLGDLEVARIGQTEGSQRTEIWEREVALEEFERVATHGTLGERHVVADPTRNDAYLLWPDEEVTQLGPDIQDALLEDDEEVAVRREVSRPRVHGLSSGEYEEAHPRPRGRIPCSSKQVHRVDPIQALVEIKRAPTDLCRRIIELLAESAVDKIFLWLWSKWLLVSRG